MLAVSAIYWHYLHRVHLIIRTLAAIVRRSPSCFLAAAAKQNCQYRTARNELSKGQEPLNGIIPWDSSASGVKVTWCQPRSFGEAISVNNFLVLRATSTSSSGSLKLPGFSPSPIPELDTTQWRPRSLSPWSLGVCIHCSHLNTPALRDCPNNSSDTDNEQASPFGCSPSSSPFPSMPLVKICTICWPMSPAPPSTVCESPREVTAASSPTPRARLLRKPASGGQA